MLHVRFFSAVQGFSLCNACPLKVSFSLLGESPVTFRNDNSDIAELGYCIVVWIFNLSGLLLTFGA